MTSLLLFFVITYVVTWACFFGSAALRDTGPPFAALRWPVFYLGVFAPSLVALALTARVDGSVGIQALLRRLIQSQVRARWYVFAVGYMAAIKLASALVYRLTTGTWPRFGEEAWYIILVAIVFSTLGQAGEEIGWRGYALPRLAERIGLGGGSVILGVTWALWHLPLFFIFPEADTHGQSFPGYLLSVTALSVAIAWLYAHTRGSLLLTMLMHSAINQTKNIVSSAVPGATNPMALSTSLLAWITIGLLWLCAGYFLLRMPRVAQSPGEGE